MNTPPNTFSQDKDTEANHADVETPKITYSVDDIIKYESGELTQSETVELFQKLVDSGHAWKLQGHYGRVANILIEAGLVIPRPSDPGITK